MGNLHYTYGIVDGGMAEMKAGRAGRAALKSNLGGTHAQYSGYHSRCYSPSELCSSVHDFACCIIHGPTGLFFVPLILSEAMAATKEMNEKTHNVAHDLLIAVGHKMKPAWLTPPPPMVSAVTMSRLSFEIRKDLDPAMVSEMISMLHLHVGSFFREIDKPALGSITTICLDVEITRPLLQEIVSGIILWPHENKGHFKVRHILEYSNTPEMGLEGDADEEREEATKKSDKPQVTFGRAYDDALYGGERDLGDGNSEEEDSTTGKTTQKNSKKRRGVECMNQEFLGSHSVVCHSLSSKLSGITTRIDLDQAESDYLESAKSADGFTSKQGGKIRFNKTNRRGAQGKDEDTEVEMAGGAGPIRPKLKKKKQVKLIGQDRFSLHNPSTSPNRINHEALSFSIMNLSGYHNSTSETSPGEETSSSEHDAALLQPQGLRTPGWISKKPRYNVESDPFNPFSSRNNNQSLGHEQGQDQGQDRDSQEPQNTEGEEREPGIQSELETTRRLAKTMDAMDLSMTETREKLKTFCKTADRRTHYWTCGFVYCRKQNIHKNCFWILSGKDTISRNHATRGVPTGHGVSQQSSSIVWSPRQPLYHYTIGPFLINAAAADDDDTAIDRKHRRFFGNITLVISFLSIIWSPDNDVF
ncbi:MAG: hypothetical protein J3Q66DRAFT_400931 [Benniella sp.]|nr:MAG: hypothetical protein J3Q66DRAFT_400931 [Benniella sp.]